MSFNTHTKKKDSGTIQSFNHKVKQMLILSEMNTMQYYSMLQKTCDLSNNKNGNLGNAKATFLKGDLVLAKFTASCLTYNAEFSWWKPYATYNSYCC